MSIRPPSLKTLAIALPAFIGACLLFAWLALPRIIQSQAEEYISARTGHRLSLDRPEFNPFELRLRIANLRLGAPDGKPLLAFRELTIDLSAASIIRRALVFDSIRLDDPEATVVLQADGRLNWSPLIDALKGRDDGPGAALPRLDIQSLILSGGKLDFSDVRAAFATRIQPLDLALNDISTLPEDRGRYTLSARTSFGAKVAWHGDATLNPMLVAGSIGVENLELAGLAPYLMHPLLSAPPTGSAQLSTDYRLTYADGRLGLTLDKVRANLARVRLKTAGAVIADIAIDALEANNGHFDLADHVLTLGSIRIDGGQVELPRPAAAPIKLLQFGDLALQDIRLDVPGKNLSVGRGVAKNGRLKIARDPQGHLDVVAAWRELPQPVASTKPAKQPGGGGWHFRADQVELSGWSANLRDESVSPFAELALEDIAVAVKGVSDDLTAPLPVRASFRARDGGTFEASGQVVPGDASADLKFKLAGLALKPVQPYVSTWTALTLASGMFAAEGRIEQNRRGSSFKGSASLSDVRLDEAATGEHLIAWKSLGTRDLKATTAKLDVADLVIDALDTRLTIHKDKSVNVGGILRKKAAAGEPTSPPAAATPAGTAKPAAPFEVNIDRLRVRNSELDFADESLALPFATRIHRLRGAVIGLSSRPSAPGQVELEGEVDDYGLARAVGQIDFFNPTGFTDLKVTFRNVEMTRLTPYSATFAGRKIQSGKLSLDLEYKVKQRRLAGDNQITMDQLTLGERVEGPSATSLPLDLVIALLQDADGRIDLALPVSGSLDDPQFSYGGLFWKAIVNVVGKIATAPFRALGALFGGGAKLESIAFETGDARLTPPEREKLVKLAAALNQRPGLSLTMHGVYAEADRLSLQESQLRRAVAERAGQRLAGQEHPGPLSTRTPAVQAAVESLYTERMGGSELAVLKEAFRKANPGQLDPGVAGRMMSRLSGLMREEKPLSEQEVSQMKGIDFHAMLFERLRDRETITDAQLLSLGRVRGEHIAAGLKTAGAPAERVILAPPEKVESDGRMVPLKLVLGAAQRPAAAAGD